MVFLEGQRKLTKQSQCGSTPKASHSFTNLFAMADIKDVGWLLGRLVYTWRRTVREGSSMKASLIERSASWCLPEHPRPAELQLNWAPSPELHVICIYIYIMIPVPAILPRNLAATPGTQCHTGKKNLLTNGLFMSWQIGWPLWMEDRNSSRSSARRGIQPSKFHHLETFPQRNPQATPETLTQATQNGLKKSERRR